MRYSLLLHYPEPAEGELDPELIAEGMRSFDEYARALDASGLLRSAEVLQQTPATTAVSRVDGELTVQNGPFAEGPERLGAIFVIEVPDLDAALHWASRAPSAAWGHVEVRPTASRFVNGAWRSEAPGA